MDELVVVWGEGFASVDGLDCSFAVARPLASTTSRPANASSVNSHGYTPRYMLDGDNRAGSVNCSQERGKKIITTYCVKV